MFIENIKYFIENGDFDMLMEFINSADPLEILKMPPVFLTILIIVGLLSHPKTTYLGQKAIMYMPAAIWLFVSFVVLSNDVISNAGPFILALGSFFIIIGGLIYTQLLSND